MLTSKSDLAHLRLRTHDLDWIGLDWIGSLKIIVDSFWALQGPYPHRPNRLGETHGPERCPKDFVRKCSFTKIPQKVPLGVLRFGCFGGPKMESENALCLINCKAIKKSKPKTYRSVSWNGDDFRSKIRPQIYVIMMTQKSRLMITRTPRKWLSQIAVGIFRGTMKRC